jgi:hypothetical protein
MRLVGCPDLKSRFVFDSRTTAGYFANNFGVPQDAKNGKAIAKK